MPRFKEIRKLCCSECDGKERKQWRVEFGQDGLPSPASRPPSDVSFFAERSSPEAERLLGLHAPRVALKIEGEGWLEGFIVRDVC